MQPLIVMMMMTFFAQWRFFGCYTLANTEVLVLNGAAVMAYAFMLWYTIWGFVQKTHLLGVCTFSPIFLISMPSCMALALIGHSRGLFVFQTLSHANNFINAKSYARDKPLLAGYNLAR